jgi:purine-binding chemotaxis protein CheW
MSPATGQVSASAASPASTELAAELRGLFDAAFSQPPPAPAGEFENLLAIRVGANPYALRLSELAGLVADQTFTRVPASTPSVFGVASLRGLIVAGYDLRVLLGQVGGTPLRWLALAATDSTVGLAFDELEGHVSVSTSSIAAQEGEQHRTHTHEVVRVGQTVRPIIHLPSVVETIKGSAKNGTTHRE